MCRLMPKHIFFLLLLTSISGISIHAQTITIQNSIVQPNFLGMGFNMSQNSQYNTTTGIQGSTYALTTWNNFLGKRIRESCSHGYFRNFSFSLAWYAPTSTSYNWTDYRFVNYCDIVKKLKENDIDIINCARFDINPAWLGGGQIITDATIQDRYAQVVADGMDYMINILGLTNIKSWEITNELTIKDATGTSSWGGFYGTQASGGPSTIAQNCHKALISKVRTALNAKGLQSVVIRSGGMSLPDMFNWTNDNHPESTTSDFHWYGVKSSTPGFINWGPSYGVTPYPPTQTDTTWYLPEQYNYFTSLYKYRVARAKSVNKDCAVGEYGPISTGDINTSVGSSYPGTESRQIGDGNLGTFFADQAVALLNAGILTFHKWSLVDLKYNRTYMFYNHGSMTDSIDGWKPRSDWYSYGLMTRYIRKNSSVYNVSSSDNLLHAAAIKNNSDGNWTVVVVNRKDTDAPVSIHFNGTVPTKPLRKFVYDPANWPQNDFGDLQEYVKKVSVSGTSMTDVIAANTMALYTTEYDETPPAAVTGLTPTSGIGTVNLTWNANTESDICYYRIYRGETADFVPSLANQIASTIATTFKYFNNTSTSYFKISAVDKYGNASLLNSLATTNETFTLPKLQITPNPTTSGNVKLYYGKIANIKLAITDLCGREIQFNKSVQNENSIAIQLNSSCKPGIYIVNIITKNGISSNKLIVQ